MSDRDAIQQAFDVWGRSAGLEKKSGSWYRLGDEVTSVSTLQKSQYGPSYYINQAFWLRQLGDERFPKDNKCHIRLRLRSLVGADAEWLNQLLDLAWVIPDEDRIVELIAILDERLSPIVERGDSLKGLRGLLDEGAFKASGISGPAQQTLAAIALWGESCG